MAVKAILVGGFVVLVTATWAVAFFAAPGQATEALAPDEVVRRFYDGYVTATDTGEVRMHPLVDRAYRANEFLSASFIAAVDAYLDAPSSGGGDPFLLAQDVPVVVRVGKSLAAGDEAQVMVDMFWGGNAMPSERLVTLKRIDGRWRIAGVGF